jgi:hypothetical protein
MDIVLEEKDFNKKVLLLEYSNQDFKEMAINTFCKRGFSCMFASNVFEAEEILKRYSNEIKVIFVDYLKDVFLLNLQKIKVPIVSISNVPWRREQMIERWYCEYQCDKGLIVDFALKMQDSDKI